MNPAREYLINHAGKLQVIIGKVAAGEPLEGEERDIALRILTIQADKLNETMAKVKFKGEK